MSPEEVSKLALGIYRLHWKTGSYSLAAVGMLYDGDRWFACANHTSNSLHGIASYQWEKVERADRIDFSLGTGGGGPIGDSSTNPTSVDKLHRTDAVSVYPVKSSAIDRVDRASAKFGPLDASQLRAMAHGWMNVDEVTLLGPAVMARHVLDALDALAIIHGTEAESHVFDELMEKMARRERGDST